MGQVVLIPSQCFVPFSSKVCVKKLPKNVNFLTTPTLNTKAQKEAFTLILPRTRMMIWKTGMKKNLQMSLENKKYGWFWNCPEEAKSGKQCKYRHALPPGFVLKKDKKKSDLMNESDKVSIEELIEQKRIELNAQSKALTPVNLQTFVAWKKRKLREKAEAEAKNNEDKKKKMKSGVHVG